MSRIFFNGPNMESEDANKEKIETNEQEKKETQQSNEMNKSPNKI